MTYRAGDDSDKYRAAFSITETSTAPGSAYALVQYDGAAGPAADSGHYICEATSTKAK